VVVVCESCSTRFRVDEARIPPKGTLVRCSRCKATFIVKAPSASFEETVEDVVAEVSEAGGRPLPEPAEDLFDRALDDLGETGNRPVGAVDDEAWEFDEAPAGGPSPALGTPGRERLGAAPATPQLEEIGSPEDWDLLGDSVDAAAREAAFALPVESKPVLPPAAVSAPAPARRSEEPAPSAPVLRSGDVGRTLANAGRIAVRSTAWLALAALFSVGIARVVPRGGTALVAPAAAKEAIGLPDGEARGVHVRFVENVFAGTLFVVQGELARASADPALGVRVHWVDETGARLGAGEWARPVPAARELRERAPEALRAGPQLALQPAPLEGPFAAIFDTLPNEATGVALALERLPSPPPPAEPEAPATSTPEEAASSAPAAADATASSPPSPRPASE